jgi:hypothetical protein
MELKSVADLVCDLVKPAEIAAHSTPLATPKAPPALGLSPISTNSDGQPLAVPEDDDFWRTLRARIDECDRLINQLCDRRGDDDDHRAALLRQRKRMAPQKLDTDIAYLKQEINRITKDKKV